MLNNLPKNVTIHDEIFILTKVESQISVYNYQWLITF